MDLDTVKMYMQLLKYLFQYRIVKNRSVILVIVLFSGIAAFTGYRAKKSLMSYRRRKLYMKKREVRRNECKNALQSLRRHLAGIKVEESESITQCSSSQLRQGIKQGKFKVIDVVRAFQQKALAVHDQTNCLVEPIHNAEDAAIEADGSDKHGLLAGIPVSFKNDVMIKGHVSCQGSAYLLENVAKDDCALVKVIKRHGGIPFMRTNLPLLCKSIESGNPIYGVTEHAHRKGFSPGGSSSGEGALVGGGGSILGIGSDIGGSIRIPAHFNGICGFKPTNGRMSKYDQFSLLHYSQTPIKVTFGPLARDVDTLILACRALWDGSFRDFDPIFPPLKLNDEKLEDKRALRIGWFSRHEDFVTPVPACQRAVQMAKHHLQNAGHTLIPWTPPAKDVRMSYSLLWADRGEQLQTVVEDEDMPVSWRHIESTVKTPYWKRWLKHKLFCVTSPQKAKQMKCTLGARSILDYWTNEVDLQNYRYKVLSEMKEMGLDAILCPPLHVPALPLGTIKTAMNGFEYVFLFNVLDFPAGVVKMTRVTSGDIEDMASYPERTQDDIALKKMMQETEGLPVGVQVAAATWEDEVCLRVMKELEGATDCQTDGRDHSK